MTYLYERASEVGRVCILVDGIEAIEKIRKRNDSGEEMRVF
jgi:hypothetical protein